MKNGDVQWGVGSSIRSDSANLVSPPLEEEYADIAGFPVVAAIDDV